jgi:hypothetical protein
MSLDSARRGFFRGSGLDSGDSSLNSLFSLPHSLVPPSTLRPNSAGKVNRVLHQNDTVQQSKEQLSN